MKKLEIIEKIPKLPLPSVTHSNALAATHLANKVSKIIKDIDKLENPDEVLRYLK